MAIPNCPRCQHTGFSIKDIEPHPSTYQFAAVHCSSCGAIVGITTARHVPTLLDRLAKALNVSLK